MNENAAPSAPDETISLEKLLEKLAGQAEHLQQALIERKPEIIMAALAEQEKLMHLLQTRQDRPADDDPAPDDTERRHAVGALAVRARGLQRTNRRLAAAFLEVVDRTMSFLQKSAAPRAGAYNASGAVCASNAPILVQQQG
jgi:hypothetical protein